MKYIKPFNEALGISYDIEQQTYAYMKQMEEDGGDKFQFVYSCDEGNCFFTLLIKDKLEDGAFGQFIVSDIGTPLERYTIEIERGRGKYTILHEVKHLDYFLKQKKKFTDTLFKASRLLHNMPKGQYLNIIKEMFYVFDKNEFESQYHSYYVMFDEYISQNIHKYKNPSEGDIAAIIYECLANTNNKAFTWWWNKAEFKFDYYFNDRDLNKILYELCIKEDFGKYDLLYDVLGIVDIKKFFKRTLNIYSDNEKLQMDKLKRQLEGEINRRRTKFRKKFIRLFAIMSDKYSK